MLSEDFNLDVSETIVIISDTVKYKTVMLGYKLVYVKIISMNSNFYSKKNNADFQAKAGSMVSSLSLFYFFTTIKYASTLLDWLQVCNSVGEAYEEQFLAVRNPYLDFLMVEDMKREVEVQMEIVRIQNKNFLLCLECFRAVLVSVLLKIFPSRNFPMIPSLLVGNVKLPVQLSILVLKLY